MALFPFEERGFAAKDYGAKVSDLLFAKLVVRPELFLVDRNDLKKTLQELELNLSGVVKAGDATRVGQLTGAKILVSGSVVQVDKKLYLVARIIGTETSRVVGALPWMGKLMTTWDRWSRNWPTPSRIPSPSKPTSSWRRPLSKRTA